MGHEHHHHHHHNHGVVKYKNAFLLGIALNFLFVAAEIFYGLMANSSALLADAGHNASDVLSLVFAWVAAFLATKKPTTKHTYGYRKTTILVSILNAFLLLGAVVVIGWDAFQKIKNPEPVAGNTVMLVAAIGVVINTFTALLFMKGQKEDLNIRGAFLHMAADAAVSLGVVVGGLLITWTGFYLIDPILSFIIMGVIVWSTWNLLTESVNLALDAVPKEIDLENVKQYLQNLEGVENVHDLHIWAMSTTQTALTAHLVVPGKYSDQFIYDVQKKLHDRFDIGHATLQIEKTFSDRKYCDDCGNERAKV